MLKELGTFLSSPQSWFSLGAVIIGLAYVIFYDVVWTWIMKNEWSDWWFERAQAWVKIGVYIGIFGIVALVIFTPWPWDLIIAIALIIAVILIITWLKKNNHI